MKEKVKITVVTNADNICPYCKKYVDPKENDSEYIVSGHGKFRRKQYFHHDCLIRRITGNE